MSLTDSERALLKRLVEAARRLNPADPARVQFVFLNVENDKGRLYAIGLNDDDGELVPFEPVPV